MSLMRGLSAARSAILRRFQVGYNEFPLSTPVSVGIFRGMAEGTFLDKNDVTDRVLSIVKNFEKVEPGKVTPSADFQKDLGLDSLDTVEVVMAFEEEFCIEIPDSEADKILSTSDAISYISGHPQAK
ncbi:hypothetical protein BSKO_03757 [Bryopsis sp. KO-2023]|nr:hypothetical protein BSKO_03757 [Bryopsis sp. KO-2023]